MRDDKHRLSHVMNGQPGCPETRCSFTFLTGLWVGTALKADDRSPMFISLFLLTVMAEYFSATFSLSFTSLLACFTSGFASPAGSDMVTVAVCVYVCVEPYLDRSTTRVVNKKETRELS